MKKVVRLNESQLHQIINEAVRRVLKEGKFLPDSVTYAKTADMKQFKAIDLGEGVFVGNIIYATCLDNTPENQEKLQRLADNNKEIDLVLQLRQNNKIVFQTK